MTRHRGHGLRALLAEASSRVRAFATMHARLCLCVVAIAPFVPAAWQILHHGIPDVLFTGDGATLELRTLHAAHGQQRLGPYSRFLWSHPGPAYFYLALPFYEALGRRGPALNVFVLVANLAGAIALVSCARKLRGGIFALLVGCILGVYEMMAVPFAMSSEWNPTVPLLPFAFLSLLGARLALGTLWALPGFVFVGSAVVQTHLGYAPEVCWLTVVALLGLVASRGFRAAQSSVGAPPRAPEGRFSRCCLLVSSAVLVLCWALPVLEDVTGHPGNLQQLRLFFTSPHPPEHTFGVAAIEVLSHMSLLPLAFARAFHLAQHEPAWGSVKGLALAEILMVVAALLTAIRRRDRVLAILSLIAVGEVGVAIAAVRAIRGEIFPYLVMWTSVIGFTSFVVGAAWIAGAPRGDSPASRRLAVGLTALGLLCLGVAVARKVGAVQLFRAPDLDMEALARDVERNLVAMHAPRPVARTVSPDTWSPAIAVVLHLHKQSMPIAVAKDLVFLAGQPLAPHPEDHVWLDFGDAAFAEGARLRPDLTPVGASPAANVYVYVEDAHYLHEHRVPVDASSVSGRGVVGDPRRAVDDILPDEGDPWDSPRSVVLTSTASSLTVEVPPGDIVGVFLSGDGNDLYALRCVAIDGLSFFLGAAGVADGELGMRTHALFSEILPSCRFMEIMPVRGDGLYSIGEVGFLRR